MPDKTATDAVFQSLCRPIVIKLPKNPPTASPTSIPISFNSCAIIAGLIGVVRRYEDAISYF